MKVYLSDNQIIIDIPSHQYFLYEMERDDVFVRAENNSLDIHQRSGDKGALYQISNYNNADEFQNIQDEFGSAFATIQDAITYLNTLLIFPDGIVITGENIDQFNAVMIRNDEVLNYDSSDISNATYYAGISESEALSGTDVGIVSTGNVNVSLGFSANDKIFSDSVGVLSSVDVTGTEHLIGSATNATDIFLIDYIPVFSVFNRTGNVTAESGDYISNQISYQTKKVVRSLADFPTPVANVINLASVIYEIDGAIDLLGNALNIPNSGTTIIGYSQNDSKIVDSTPNFTMFTGGGNLFMKDLQIAISGTDSKVFGVVSNSGFESLEYVSMWFDNCTSLGFVDSYRQFFCATLFCFNCSDGLEFRGTWIGGAKIQDYLVIASTGTAFKKGAGLVFNSRFNSNANLSVPFGNLAYDFEDVNFNSDGLYQLKGGNFQNGGYQKLIFDGAISKLTTPVNALFDFNSDFSIDFWMSSVDLSLQGGNNRRAYSGGIEVMFNDATNGIIVYNNNTASNIIDSGTGLNDGLPHHINVYRNSGTIYLEIDGVNFGSAVNGLTFLTGTEIAIGALENTLLGLFAGSIWNIRIRNGSFESFTPLTLPVDSKDYLDKTDVILFLPKDSDSSPYNRSMTNINVTLGAVINGDFAYLAGLDAKNIKSDFRSNVGISNTFPSAEWTNIIETPNTFTVIGLYEDANVTVLNKSLVWFSAPSDGVFEYLQSTPITVSIACTASVIGGNNKIINLAINHFIAESSTNEIVSRTTGTANGGVAQDRAESISLPPTILEIKKGDQIKLQIANNSDLSDLTIAQYSKLTIIQVG